ncbi:hypothetical protein C8J56DRAFT_896269 [Mycena floridula]|nr:hypothetical protein C8J56DRAFT_896269 [Mycena floridula]
MANPNAAYLMLPPWERLALEVWDLIGDEIEALDDGKVVDANFGDSVLYMPIQYNLEDTVPKHVTQFNRLDTFPLRSFTLIMRSLLDYELPQFIAQFSTLDEFKIHCIDFVKHHDTMKLSRLSSILPIDWKRIEMLTITYHGSAYNLVGPALAPLFQACASNVQTLEIRLDECYSGFLFEHMISLSDLSLIIPISQPQICTSVLTQTPNLKNFHLCLLTDDHMSGDLQGWKELGHLDDWISPKLGNVQRRRRWTLRPIEGGSELSFEQMVLFRKTMLQVARKGWTGRGWASPDDFGESFEDAGYLSEPDDSVGRYELWADISDCLSCNDDGRCVLCMAEGYSDDGESDDDESDGVTDNSV